MDSDSTSFVNGILAGAGAVVAIMAFAFMQLVSRYEGIMGVTTVEMRAAIILGAIVCAAAVGYEFYRRRPIKAKQGVSGE
ncbi:MAG: hypothetical protein ACE5KA_06525 [Nitrososphaerales archaeon]